MRRGYVPVKPFRDWLLKVRKYYPSNRELSSIIGMSAGKINAIIDGTPYSDGKHNQAKKPIDKLAISTVDNAMTREGHFHIVEFYPEVYDNERDREQVG